MNEPKNNIKIGGETNPKNNAQINKQVDTQTTAQQLHREFVRLGGMRHKLKNRLLAILPEIYKSGIWKKYAGTIEEYAGKFGDIAKTTVKKRLRLEENLEDKPFLKAAIEKVGIHKVALVAKIATSETDQAFAENIMNMSKMVVQSLSKELRAGQAGAGVGTKVMVGVGSGSGFGGRSGHFNAVDQKITMHDCDFRINQNQFCKAVPLMKKIELDEESTFLFMKLKAKLGKNLTDKEFFKLILKKMERQEFAEKQSKIDGNHKSAAVAEECITGDTFPGWVVTSRYIPINKKRQIIAQTNGKCSYPNCNLPYEVLHHINRYSKSKNHDSIIPLCKIHHEFAHNNLIQNENLPVEKWQLLVAELPAAQITQAEILYRKYRQKLIA